MINLEDLLKIQNVSSSRSKNPGILVIPKHKLAKLINNTIPQVFTQKHLNIALKLYCRQGYAINIILGKKKYNLIAEKVPGFLIWFFRGLEKDLYNEICEEYEKDSLIGMKHIRKRGQVNSPSTNQPDLS